MLLLLSFKLLSNQLSTWARRAETTAWCKKLLEQWRPKIEELINKGRKACEKDGKNEEIEVEEELKSMMRGFFDAETANKTSRLEKSKRIKIQSGLLDLLGEKVRKRSAERRAPEEDSLVLKEMEELGKGKNESPRMTELFSERRLRAVRKREMSDFCMWRKDVMREKKRIRKEEKNFRLEDTAKRVSAKKRKDKEEEKEEDEMSLAASWAIERARNIGESG